MKLRPIHRLSAPCTVVPALCPYPRAYLAEREPPCRCRSFFFAEVLSLLRLFFENFDTLLGFLQLRRSVVANPSKPRTIRPVVPPFRCGAYPRANPRRNVRTWKPSSQSLTLVNNYDNYGIGDSEQRNTQDEVTHLGHQKAN